MVFACVAVREHMFTVIATGTELNCAHCHLSFLVECRWSDHDNICPCVEEKM